MAVGDIYQLTVVGKYMNQDWVNVLTYRQTAIGTGLRPETALMTQFDIIVSPTWEAAVVASCVALTLRCAKVFPLPRGATFELGIGWAGILTPDGLPSEVAGVVKKLSDFAGKHGRGRNYIPGMPVDSVIQSTGLFQPAQFHLLQDIGGVYVAPMVASTGETFEAGVMNHLTGAFTPVTRGDANDAPRVQRRRQPGRGH